ncbi:amidohydrolase family protein [Mucilaginibacter arboris]|uniref:Amidohydrolase family protein n=1 Tax=Mucilaginibacter arboris TaxID=2682090 RepID=A0A7K1SSE1_9SPHI|nr:amidohydrolase family protein [Mucilaginibacter arboris]MVN20020.1 amidohydrolase family protein [Mucilaginibacter arboris]
MLKIDAHQHFWKFDPVRDSWIDETMSAIQRDFLPEDLKPILKQNGLEGCVAVQSDQSETENEFQLKNAASNDFIKGVVGWVDLCSPQIEERLKYYSQFKLLKGFRHILQGEPDASFMLQKSFMHGISLLNKHHFTYDILIFPIHLQNAKTLAQTFPNQPFVIDHIAKPNIKNKTIDTWKKGIKAIAELENVSCKVSGMVTEADWKNWKPADFTPYLDVVFEAFGTKRVIFGSDWPVCNVAGGYEKMLSIVQNYTSAFTQNEQELFWGGNAIRFYNL